jgi:hypothetical protein
LAVLTQLPRSQRLQPDPFVPVSNCSGGIEDTPETAEPSGVSPPEAVDLLWIKELMSAT